MSPTGLWSPEFLLMVSYGILTLPVYLATVLTILLNGKTFRGSFFRLYLTLATLNMIIYFTRYFITRLPVYTCGSCALSGFFDSASPVFAAVILAFFYHCLFSQYVFTAVIAVDRFIVLRGGDHLAKLWKSSYMYVILLVLLFPTPITQAIARGSSVYRYEPSTDGYHIVSNDTKIIDPAINITTAVSIPLGCVMNLLVIWSFTMGNMKLNTRQRKTEIKLFVNSIMDTSAQVLTSVFMITQLFFRSNPVVDNIFRKCIIFGGDAIGLLPPYVLLFTSDQLRRTIFHSVYKRNSAVSSFSIEYKT